MTTTIAGTSIKLIVDVAVLHDGRVLLVRYAEPERYDQQRGWFLPDDLLHDLESPEAGAARVLAAQPGVADTSVRLGTVESFRGRDGTWHLAFHDRADVASDTLTPTSALLESRWFALDALPPRAECAHHGWALDVLRST